MKKFFYCTSFLITLFHFNSVLGQQIPNKNFTIISENDTQEEIILKAAQIVPTEQQYNWQKLEFIAFVHFGMNTFTNKEWGEGNENPNLFNPQKLDAEQWISTFKNAGMKMAILTAKHHDGFCLWPSKFTEHSVKFSKWKNGKGDVVKEFVDACKKYEMKIGLYLSPWDKNNPNYGDSPKYNEYYLNQLRELLTNYGEINEVWFDGACGEGPNGKKQVYDWQSYYKLIRELQPNAVIFGMSPDIRWVGTETGYGRETEWSVIPIDLSRLGEIDIDKVRYPIDMIYNPHDYTDYDLGSREKIVKAKGLFWYPAETDVSIRPGWFFHPEQNDKVKLIDKLLDIYFSSVGRNGVFLLNVPPDKEGLIHENDIESLMGLKNILQKTFQNNLVRNSKVAVNNEEEVNLDSFINPDKHWISKNNYGGDTIELILDSEKTFDVILLQEEIRLGQRIEKFRIDFWNDNQWKKLTEGTTIGYKRLLRINPTATQRIRVVIEQARLNPAIANIGLYKLSN